MNRKLICMMFGLAFLGSGMFAQKKTSELLKIDAQDEPTETEIRFWSDAAADEFAGGDGTESSPYRIENAAQFAKLSHDVFYDGKTFENTWFTIENDLDLGQYYWLPIGFMSSDDQVGRADFAGKVDGKGHNIINLQLVGIGNFTSMGLFGRTSSSFELRNLTILSGVADGEQQVGPFVGFNYGLVENCVNYVDATCLMYYAGGIVGANMSTGKIVNCQNYGNVQAGYDTTQGLSAAGISGSSSGTIEQCANFGNINSRTSGSGGIVAIMEGGKISQCFNRGNLNAATEQAGGIVASVLGRESACEISNCYSACEITYGKKMAIGGLVGVAIMNRPYKFVMKNNYFDFSLFEGANGEFHDNFSMYTVENNVGLYSSNMKSADFVTTLNNESDGNTVWSEDVNNINDGYPVLEFMKDYVVGVSEPENNETISVIAENNSIRIAGIEETSPVKVYSVSGLLVFNGTVAQLSSRYFDNGIYLLVANGKSMKVYLK